MLRAPSMPTVPPPDDGERNPPASLARPWVDRGHLPYDVLARISTIVPDAARVVLTSPAGSGLH